MVDEWFAGFVSSLSQRIPIAWPPGDSEFWDVVRGVLITAGANREVADQALMRVAKNGIQFVNDLIEPLRKAIGEVWREQDANAGHAPDSREAAKADPESRSCRDCHGDGIASRYLRDPNHPRHGASFSVYCVCPIGRWIERYHREKLPEVRRSMVALADRPDLRLGPVRWTDVPDNKSRIPPRMWDDVHDCPIPVDRTAHVTAIASRNRGDRTRSAADIHRESPRPLLGRAEPKVPITRTETTPGAATR